MYELWETEPHIASATTALAESDPPPLTEPADLAVKRAKNAARNSG